MKLLNSVRESAETLGVSVRTVHRYCSLGVLPHVRIGRRKMFRTEDLVKFAQSGVSTAVINRAKGGQ